MTKSVFIIDIDSNERAHALHPNPNDYIIKLNRPLYDVSSLKIISTCIPKTQALINSGNKHLTINGTHEIVLNEGTWETGNALANTLTTQLVNYDGLSNSVSVSFNALTSKLTFTGAAPFSFNFLSGNSYNPAEVFGFPLLDTGSPQSTLISPGVINLTGPASLVLNLSSGAEHFRRDVYNESVKFTTTSRIAIGHVNIGNTLYIGNEYITDHTFHTGHEKVINYLRINFFYSNGTELIPYDFGYRNHVLKIEVECALDKIEMLETDTTPSDKLPDPVAPPAAATKYNYNKITFIVVCLLLVFGLIALVKF